ncbi:MAG: hypothetical protein O2960_28375, partial [Verrucomicrobia bacterium]|nr:hypothetical protein [Verrucomicrobiota bacterium]
TLISILFLPLNPCGRSVKVILLEARNVFSHVTGQREPAGASGEFDSTVFIELKRPAVRLVEPARFLNQCRSGFWIFGSSHPEFHSESRLPNIKIRIVRNGDSVVAVEFKGSSHSADIEATVADDRSIMTSDTVVLISIARPPIHKSGRNRNARFPAGRSQEAGDIASRSAIDSPSDILICLPPRLGEA